MKTALTQLLDYLHLDNDYEEINENLQIHDIVMYVDKLLKMEQQDIETAFNEGGNDSHFCKDGKEYFNFKFNGNK